MRKLRWNILCVALGTLVCRAQTPEPAESSPAAPRITLRDAIERAKQYGAQIQSATFAAQLAHEDRVQVKAGLLPTLNALNQFIYTEGNGTPSGVFVANDGVHIYNEQVVVHQDLLNIVRRADLRRAGAAEAVALAKRDVAIRGLNATVTQNFYAAVAAARKIDYAKSSLDDARRFLDITQKQEKGGEAARADVIKAQLQVNQRQRDLGDTQVTVEKAKIALAVLIFPDVSQEFTTVDDLDQLPSLDDFTAVSSQATASSPDLKAARASVMQSKEEIAVAKYAYLPSFAIDFFYGINANKFSDRTDYPIPESGRASLPSELTGRNNLGYSGQATLTIPLWTWGATHSKVKQAETRAEQAKLDLSLTQRQLRANLSSYYAEAKAAQAQIDSLRGSVQLSEESLRLTLLRYQAGEATTLEVADAQTTLATARSAYVDGLSRYRVAVANLQTLTGQF